MNYYKLAMTVFKKHNTDFVKLALKREKLKQKLYLKRRCNQQIPEEEIKKLSSEIKKDVSKLNNIIKEFLQCQTK